MAVPFDPDEIDSMDEGLLVGMRREEMEAFRERLLVTLDDLECAEPDIMEEEEEYYEWETRIHILEDLIDALDNQLEG